MRNKKTDAGIAVLSVQPIITGQVRQQTGLPGIVTVGGLVAGNVCTAGPAVVPIMGLGTANIMTICPGVLEGMGGFIGNVEVLSPGVAEIYGVNALNLYAFSPALLFEVDGISSFNYGVGNPQFSNAIGVDAYNRAHISPGFIGVTGYGPDIEP